MGGDVLRLARAVPLSRDDDAVEDDDRTDRHLAALAGKPCLLEREVHEAERFDHGISS